MITAFLEFAYCVAEVATAIILGPRCMRCGRRGCTIDHPPIAQRFRIPVESTPGTPRPDSIGQFDSMLAIARALTAEEIREKIEAEIMNAFRLPPPLIDLISAEESDLFRPWAKHFGDHL